MKRRGLRKRKNKDERLLSCPSGPRSCCERQSRGFACALTVLLPYDDNHSLVLSGITLGDYANEQSNGISTSNKRMTLPELQGLGKKTPANFPSCFGNVSGWFRYKGITYFETRYPHAQQTVITIKNQIDMPTHRIFPLACPLKRND